MCIIDFRTTGWWIQGFDTEFETLESQPPRGWPLLVRCGYCWSMCIGPFAAGRDYSSMAFGIEDVQLLPMRAVSTSGARASGRGRGGGQGGHGARAARMRDLCTTPRPLQSPTDRCTWTFGRAQTTSPDLPGEGRFKTKAQAFEDLKAAIS